MSYEFISHSSQLAKKNSTLNKLATSNIKCVPRWIHVLATVKRKVADRIEIEYLSRIYCYTLPLKNCDYYKNSKHIVLTNNIYFHNGNKQHSMTFNKCPNLPNTQHIQIFCGVWILIMVMGAVLKYCRFIRLSVEWIFG